MLAGKGDHALRIEIRVAIPASVPTSIILTYINAFQASAFRPLVRVFFCFQCIAGQPRNQAAVDAAAVPDTVFIKVDSLSAGAQLQFVFRGNLCKSSGKHIHFRLCTRPYIIIFYVFFTLS